MSNHGPDRCGFHQIKRANPCDRIHPESCDYKLISKKFSDLIYTELFTVSVLLISSIFYGYKLDITGSPIFCME
jgi:hypothetical protein